MPDLKNVPPSPRPRRLSQLKDAWKNKRSVTIVYLLLRASVILVLIAQIFNRNFENVFLCVLTLFLFGVPNMVQHRLDIELPNRTAKYAGNYHPAVYLCGGNLGRD